MTWLNNYLISPTHQWWVDNVWRPSWTKLWSGIYGIPSAAIAGVSYVSQMAGDDKVTSLLEKMHLPDGVFVALSAAALITYVAHGR